MPHLFVVSDQTDLTALTKAVLTGRTGRAARDRAADAIRRANPTLDLDRLRPGAVVVVPDLAGLRAGVEDPPGEAADEVAERLVSGLKSLVSELELAEQRRQAEKKQAQDLFGSATVKRLAASVPELEENLAAVRATFKADDAEARQQLADLGEVADRWATEIAELRDLL